MKKLFVSLVLFAVSGAVLAQGLTIKIDKGGRNPTPIAVVPFSWNGSGFNGDQVAEIISDDLYRSGQFKPIEKQNLLSFPHTEAEVVYQDWRMSGAEYLVAGQLVPQAGGGFTANFFLSNVNGQKVMFSKTIQGGSNNLRDIAHYISDQVYEALTGFRGVFQTRIVYVAGNPGNVKLVLADQDGAREQVLLTSKQPVLSPDWAPDGNRIVYVSFEGGRPGIYIQTLSTGQRERLTSFPGLNGAPKFSPDGRSLAMCLSKGGNPDIYVMDIASRQLRQVTNHFAIDTEPSWTADGRSIIFTSNRGGKPQLYKVGLGSGQTERISFEGDYNAHGGMSDDGKLLAFIHRRDGVFHTAVQDVKSNRVTVLTQTSLDESPALAPNGRMIMYATQRGGQSILSTVSVDGGVQVPVPAVNGNVREPAWGPYRQR